MFLALMLELVAAEAWSRVRDRLKRPEPVWSDRAVHRLAERGELLTGQQQAAVKRWIERSDVFAAIVSADPGNLDDAVQRTVAALEHELGAPSLANRAIAERLITLITIELVELVDPQMATTLITYRAFMVEFGDLKDGQAAIYDAVDDVRNQIGGQHLLPSLEELATFPPNARQWIEIGVQRSEPAIRLTAALADLSRRREMIQALVDTPPTWLRGSGALQAALGFTAEACSLNEAASVALSRAAVDEPVARSILYAHAALAKARAEDLAEANRLVERGRLNASQKELLFVDAIDAVLADDSARSLDAASAALAGGWASDATVRMLFGQAQAATGHLDEAIRTFVRTFEDHPQHAGAAIAAARGLLMRANASSDRTRAVDLDDALKLALAGRDLRRRWLGDSGEAAELASAAALQLGARDIALRIATQSGGEATEAEASRPSLRRLAAVMSAGGPQPEFESSSEFERELLAAVQTGLDDARRAEAIEHAERAVGLAEAEEEIVKVQQLLATLGAETIPRLEETRLHNPDMADLLVAISDFERGNVAKAEANLRTLAGREAMAAVLLAQIAEDRGDVLESARVFQDAGLRFSDPRMLQAATKRYLQCDLQVEARRAVEQLAALVPRGSVLERDVDRLKLEVAIEEKDPHAVEAASRALLGHADTDAPVRWVRVQALVHLHRIKEAWSEIAREPTLFPQTEFQAILYLQLLLRRDRANLRRIVDVLDAFPDSHDVHGAGIGLFLTAELDDAVEPAVADAMRARAEQFIERFPDSPLLWSKPLALGDTEQLIESMRDAMQPDGERDDRLRELATLAMRGAVPMGFVASVVGRPNMEAYLTGDMLGFVSVPGQLAELALEIELARESRSHACVVDPSTLVAMSFVPTMWPAVRGWCSSLRVAQPVLVEIDGIVFRREPSGTLRWNHTFDRPELVELTDGEISAARSRKRLVNEWALDLSVAPVGEPSGELAQLVAGDPLHTWLQSTVAAKNANAFLLCDDVALSAVARAAGVKAFSSFALLVAMHEAGAIDDAANDDVLSRLYAAGAMDLPLTPTQMAHLSSLPGMVLRSWLRAISRPKFWTVQQESIAAYITGLQTHGNDLSSACSMLHAGTSGLLHAVVAGSPDKLTAGLLLMTTLHFKATPSEVVELVSASRAACASADRNDPFDEFVRSVFDLTSVSTSPADAAAAVMQLLSEMDSADRSRATLLLLSHQ